MKPKLSKKAVMMARVREAINEICEEHQYINSFTHSDGVGWSLFRIECHLMVLKYFLEKNPPPKTAEE